ncbi:MAG: MATE family efflux transporter [Sphingobacteriales bacterium]|nr:MAG: MATE family efflux transporter [Sphingobacteriales bacterium]
MRVLATNKNIIRLAWPILFALFIPQMSYMANTIFLGRFGELELRVIGVAGIFYLTLGMVGYGLSNGMQILMSRRAGEEDDAGLSRTLSNGIMLSLFFSLGMMMLCLWLAPIIFGLSLRDSDNTLSSIQFLYLRVWGLPFLMITQLINAFFISIHRSRFLIYGSLAGTITNILFDYLLIFGKGGFPVMGLSGAAVASILAEVVNCSIMFGAFFFNRFHRKYPIHRYFSFDLELARKSLKIASPLIVQYLFSLGGWQVFFIYVEHLGNKELAASQILRSMFGILWVGIWAFSATTNTMVSNILGQGKPSQVMYLAGKIAKLSFLYALITCAAVYFFSDQFIGLYRNDPALFAFAEPALRVVLVSTLVMSMSTIFFNAVVGTGNTLINLTIEITCVFAYLIYCYFVIEKMRMPLDWAWGSEFVYWSTLLVISLAYLKSGRWKGKEI